MGDERIGVRQQGRTPLKSTDVRILGGMIMIPAFLLQPSITVMLVQVVFLIILAALHGRKIRWMIILVFLVTVTGMNLLQVNGRVLMQVGSFSLTLGALLTGVKKALTLIGMIYLSQYMVSGRPQFPGRFGQLLAKQFLYFEHLVSAWKRPKRGEFIASLDRMLLEMEEGILSDEELGRRRRTGLEAAAGDYMRASVIAVIFWAGSFIGFADILPQALP
jgi:hypothetical protein